MSSDIVVLKSKNALPKKSIIKKIWAQIDLQLLVVPSIILVIIFSYVPMYGVLMAFQEFSLGDFPGFSPFVGLKHFRKLFEDPNFPNVFRNTLSISALKLLINFPLPILFAILLSEIRNKRFVKLTNTVSYLPHFISWVVASTLIFDMVSVDHGLINNILLGLKLVDRPVSFLTSSKYFWGMAVISDLWKELGWNAIIFTAAISAIDPQMYEAAAIDGASRWQRVYYITSATIKPTIMILLIFTVGGMLNANFDQIMLLTNQMSNGILRERADVIDTYIFRVGLSEGRNSFAAAAGLFKSLINFGLLLSVNIFAKKIGETSLY